VAGSAAFGTGFGQVFVVNLEPEILGALPEDIRFPTMTLTADEGHGVESRRHRTMITVAVIAGRSCEVLLLEHRFRVHTLLPAGKLVDR
jgi:hypothetical protein